MHMHMHMHMHMCMHMCMCMCMCACAITCTFRVDDAHDCDARPGDVHTFDDEASTATTANHAAPIAAEAAERGQ